MKILIITAMLIQILLILWGIYELYIGDIWYGFANICINATFLYVNCITLKMMNRI